VDFRNNLLQWIIPVFAGNEESLYSLIEAQREIRKRTHTHRNSRRSKKFVMDIKVMLVLSCGRCEIKINVMIIFNYNSWKRGRLSAQKRFAGEDSV
jgi:hypothetical protein